eukprot:8856692-Pyramimonas_sp.AAC.1
MAVSSPNARSRRAPRRTDVRTATRDITSEATIQRYEVQSYSGTRHSRTVVQVTVVQRYKAQSYSGTRYSRIAVQGTVVQRYTSQYSHTAVQGTVTPWYSHEVCSTACRRCSSRTSTTLGQSHSGTVTRSAGTTLGAHLRDGHHSDVERTEGCVPKHFPTQRREDD